MRKALLVAVLFLATGGGKLFAQGFSEPGVYVNFEDDSANIHLTGKNYRSINTYKLNESMIQPQAWVTFDEHLYFEARYNYEDPLTGAFFIGYDKKFGDDCNGLEINPMMAPLFGKLNGFSTAFDAKYSSCHFQVESDNEFVSAMETGVGQQNFFYDWSKLYDQDDCKYGIGISVQGQVGTQSLLYMGLMLRKQWGIVAIEIFSYYNDLKNNWVPGAIAFDIEGK